MILGLFLEKSQISPIMHLLRSWEFLAHGYTRLIICTRFSDSGKGVFSAIFRFFSVKNHLGGGKGQGRQLSAVSKFHLSARILFIDSCWPRPNQCWKMMADASDMSDGNLSMFRKNEKNTPFSWRSGTELSNFLVVLMIKHLDENGRKIAPNSQLSSRLKVPENR